MDLCNLSVIRPLLEAHGFRFSKSMGQNFLIQDWVPKRILSVAGIDRDCGVLEIGPGIGVLTQELCSVAGEVVSVELDRSLLPVLEETLSGYQNIRVINDDILKVDIPALVESVFPGLRPVVCANLPYNITTPVLRSLLSSRLFSRVTVMVQKEVARRICAKPGTADYGAFTLFVACYSRPRIQFDVTPDCFYPQPKVTSSVVTLDRADLPVPGKDMDFLLSITRAAFGQRRKTLVNALSPLFGDRLSKNDIQEVVTACGFEKQVRGETLSLEDYVRLMNGFQQYR